MNESSDVARYVTESSEESTIQNEGEGLGLLHGPESPQIVRDTINNTWIGQSQRIIRRQNGLLIVPFDTYLLSAPR
jgi:hypothetical protein